MWDWELEGRKLLNRVAKLLSEENIELGRLREVLDQNPHAEATTHSHRPLNLGHVFLNPNAEATTHDHCPLNLGHGLLKKDKRSSGKKKEQPMPMPFEVDIHPTLRNEKTEITSIFKDYGENPALICTHKCVSKKTSCKNFNENIDHLQYKSKRKRDWEKKRLVVKKKPKYINLPRNLPPPVLPQAFKDHILSTRGCLDSAILVIQKGLYDTDLSKHHNRLSLPYSQINMQFLTSKEVDDLDAPKTEIQATLVEPCLQECAISLRNWKSNSMLVLTTGWNEVVERNQLRKGMTIQLWSFRRNLKLCFALVLIN